jgi:MFS family permease
MRLSKSKQILFYSSRAFLSLISTAYAGSLFFVLREWTMTATAASSVQSGWHISYLLGVFLAGFLTDRYGARNVYICSSVLSAVATTLFCVFVSGYWSALLLYSLAGFVLGGTYTSGLALVYRLTNAGARGRSMGFFLGATSCGYAAGLLIVSSFLEFSEWRHGLYAVAAVAWLGALLVTYSLKSVEDLPFVAAERPRFIQSIISALRDRPAMSINLAYSFHCWELFALWAWMPAFLAFLFGRLNSSMANIGIVVAGVAHLASVAGSVLGGSASDRYGRLPTIAFVGIISALSSAVAGFATSWPLWMVVPFFALYSIFAIADSPIFSTVLAESVPPERLGVAFSVRSLMGFTAAAISPVVFGLILDSSFYSLYAGAEKSWTLAWLVVGTGGAIAPIICLSMMRSRVGRQPDPRST